MTKTRCLILGTSRLHRPFAKRISKDVHSNRREGIEIVFPKIGYFHTAAEALQVTQWIQNPAHLPIDLGQYIFRIEPRATTPLNEFDTDLERAIRAHERYTSPLDLKHLDSVILEISSLTINRHVPTGRFLHTNPNFLKNVPYGEIYPSGYYAKFEPTLRVEKEETSIAQLTEQLTQLKAIHAWKHVAVISHLRSTLHPNAQREKIHSMASEACLLSGCHYIDTADILDKFGFAETSGVKDVHHLSHQGEDALANRLYDAFPKNSMA